MKLRFMKFLTSRENEIGEQEDDDGTTVSAITQPGRDQSLRSSALLLSSSRFTHLSRPPFHRSSLPAATCRQAISSSYPSPAVPPLPSFFINYRSRRAWGRTVAEHPLAGPAVLPNDDTARPARLHSCSFIQSGGPASLRFQWHPLCGGWNYRKTKTENELSYFITFIDE